MWYLILLELPLHFHCLFDSDRVYLIDGRRLTMYKFILSLFNGLVIYGTVKRWQDKHNSRCLVITKGFDNLQEFLQFSSNKNVFQRFSSLVGDDREVMLRIFHSAKDGSKLNATCYFWVLVTDGLYYVTNGVKISDAFFKGFPWRVGSQEPECFSLRDGPLEKWWGGGGGDFSACTTFFFRSRVVQEFFFQVTSARIFFFRQILFFF